MLTTPSILVAEDNTHFRALLVLYLHELGGSIIECDCGLSAMQLLKKHEYDLMVFDMMLPGASGLDLLKLARHSSGNPIMVISAIEHYRRQSLDLGANIFMLKPVRMKSVVETARELA